MEGAFDVLPPLRDCWKAEAGILPPPPPPAVEREVEDTEEGE